MGKVMMSGVAPQMKAPIPYKANFADNDWADIIEACQKNAIPDTWLVGDQKAMTINGDDYLIDIIGKNHDDYADGSGKAPLTFQMHGCYKTSYAMNASNSNVGGWTSCDMRKTHLPAIFALMPTEVQSSIKYVTKKTSVGNKSSVTETTQDRLFLLSEIEIFGSTKYSLGEEGSQYDYYKAGNPKVKYKYNSSSIAWWWERSPMNNISHFCNAYKGNQYYDSAQTTDDVAFAFCF